VIQEGNPLRIASDAFFSPYTVKFMFYVIFQALAVYFNLYFLVPRLLEKGRYTAYITSLLLTVLGAASLITCGYYFGTVLSGRTFQQLYGTKNFDFFRIFVGNPLPTTVASTTLAMSIKLTKSWIQSKRRQQLLETEKLETELKFLKYQFNPHFLFNTINSIFFLIHKNPDMASDSLAKFSELLRHQLYECNDTQIPLGKEIAYLENFIELEKLRQNKNVEVTVQMSQKHTAHLGIAPFILMNFVENAFKHVSRHADKPNWIKINLAISQLELHFDVCNSSSNTSSSSDVVNYGGIGLKNVHRRLDLLYPARYSLDIQNNNTSFEVNLRLTLSEFAIAQTKHKQPDMEFVA
jgi:hypothetical protein